MHSITEEPSGAGGLQNEDDLGVFDTEGIQNILRQMNYKIEFIPFGHPHLAVIVNKTGDERGYLKFVEQEREVEILLISRRNPVTVKSHDLWCPILARGGRHRDFDARRWWMANIVEESQ
ncbi:hypothetical protein J3R83DRAFT_8829 [Lanmaoa asiatica]|nr:hypothetical protein J3R83DRAFT_8829 [Lanmaoa asiatica]